MTYLTVVCLEGLLFSSKVEVLSLIFLACNGFDKMWRVVLEKMKRFFENFLGFL